MALSAIVPAKLSDYPYRSMLAMFDRIGIIRSDSLGLVADDKMNANQYWLAESDPTSNEVALFGSAGAIKFKNFDSGTDVIPVQTLNGTGLMGAYSKNGVHVIIGMKASPFYRMYTSATKSDNPNILPTAMSGEPLLVEFSPDGNRLFIVSKDTGGSRLRVYNYPAMTQISTPDATTGLNFTPFNSAISPDGLQIIVFGFSATTNSQKVIIDTNTYLPITPAYNANLKQFRACNAVFSPDGSKIYNSGYNFSRIIDVATGNILQSGGSDGQASTSRLNWAVWKDNRYVLTVNHTGGDLVYEHDSLTNTFRVMPYYSKTLSVFNIYYRYEIICSIIETLAEADWEAIAIPLDGLTPIGLIEFTGSSFTIPVTRRTPCTVIIRPKGFGLWENDKVYNAGDNVYPTNPSVIPYYYVCSVTGTSGLTEPSWGITSGSTTNDGTIVWTLVEGLIKPDANQPVIPTIVP